MNIHLVEANDADDIFYVYETFESKTRILLLDTHEFLKWADINSVDALSSQNWYEPDSTSEYLLDEKQSALFLLRFK